MLGLSPKPEYTCVLVALHVHALQSVLYERFFLAKKMGAAKPQAQKNTHIYLPNKVAE